jgi:Fe-S-cluster-containing hydrogenase component 2
MVCYYFKSKRFNPKKSRIRVAKIDRLGVDNPIICRQCLKPPCIEACPTGALYKDGEIVKVEEEKCVGCEICLESCIIGAIGFDREKGIPLICDLCGGDPVCVKWCPTGALCLRDGFQGKKLREYTERKAETLLEKWGLSVKIPFSEDS